LLLAAIAQTWGVGYALNNASEWQDVAITACKAALLIVILDAMRLTKNASWFEEHGACVRFVIVAPRLAYAPHSLTLLSSSFASSAQWTLCPCRRRSSTARRAAGGRRRARSSSCRRG
jgi:hypothetical protein